MKPEKIIEAFPAWKEVMSKIGIGKHLIIHSPQNYMQREVLKSVMSNSEEISKSCIINVDNRFVHYNGFDYQSLWGKIVSKTKIVETEYGEVDDANSFQECLTKFIKINNSPVIFIIDTTSINPFSSFQLVDRFHKCLSSITIEERLYSSTSIIILDDYSIYFKLRKNIIHLENSQKESIFSDLDYFNAIYFWPVSEKQIFLMLSSLFGQIILNNHGDVKKIASKIYQLSGGHQGLVLSLLSFLNECVYYESELLVHWERSDKYIKDGPLYRTLKSIITENKTIVDNAFKLLGKEAHIEDENADFDSKLFSYGIINKGELYIEFCPGLISEIVDGIQDYKRENISSIKVAQEVKEHETTIKNSDFVVVHISDLHINEEFPFSLSFHNDEKDKKSIINMFKRDIEKMGIEKVDAFVISGDFTFGASISEFRRAVSFVRELCEAINYDATKVVLVAGNHDVLWNPPSLDSREETSLVSRDNFRTFIDLLGITRSKNSERVYLHHFESTNKKKILRVLTLDSNVVEGEKSGGIGYFGQDDLEEAERLIDESNKQNNLKFEQISTWIVTHHHIYPATSATSHQALNKKISMTANVPELISFSVKHNIEVILHGHEHQPNITISTPLFIGSGLSFEQIITVGAGSFSSKRDHLGPFSKNHYFIISKKLNEIIIMSRALAADDREFQNHVNILIPSNK